MDALANESSGQSGLARTLISVRGLVQGVGFRPFVYRAAVARGLFGWVNNGPAGVTIDVEGASPAIADFMRALRDEAPALARIDSLSDRAMPSCGYTEFAIRDSDSVGAREALVSPDVATCPDCLAELLNPADRRYRYPFSNCTNCGPRYSIIDGLPYDRPLTAMRAFPMCPTCAAEYGDPADRRFHAQPDACERCGPSVWYVSDLDALRDPEAPGPADALDWSAIEAAVAALRGGGLVAIKGLGGFHLACDAADQGAVQRLRDRKHRPVKPFALMVPDLATARSLCAVSPEEAALLASPQAPIVLLDRQTGADAAIAEAVAPGQLTLGIMLPYTPLQHLLLREFGGPLVMTSGNISDEPLAATNSEAARDLAGIADAGMLLHNRDITHRIDDSVARVVDGAPVIIRRARGQAPSPLPFAAASGDIIALGGQEKAAFCVSVGERAFLSHHLGELDNPETLDFFSDSLAHYRALFQPSVAAVAADLHPDYASTRLARRLAGTLAAGGVPVIAVQHHHAHIAAVLGEHDLHGEVIGVAFDGTGLGDDGALWGGEILICDRRGYRRFAHLAPFPLPGGELAIRRPYRTAYGLLAGAADGPLATALARVSAAIPPDELPALAAQTARGLNAPMTTSIGRLFDAAAVVCGFTGACTYEAEAAIWLENLAGPLAQPAEPYQPVISDGTGPVTLDGSAIIAAMTEDLARGLPAALVARRFHATITMATRRICRRARAATGLTRVCLGGGVFMNRRLLTELTSGLRQDGFEVHFGSQAPPNDGGLAYGQAIVAAARMGE